MDTQIFFGHYNISLTKTFKVILQKNQNDGKKSHQIFFNILVIFQYKKLKKFKEFSKFVIKFENFQMTNYKLVKVIFYLKIIYHMKDDERPYNH